MLPLLYILMKERRMMMGSVINVQLTKEEINRICEWLDVLIAEGLQTDEDIELRDKLEEYE